MPFSSYATVADVRDLGLAVADANDSVVEKWLTRAERRIDQITHDRFLPEANITITLSAQSSSRILLLPRRIRTITSVTVQGSTMAASDYEIHRSLNASGTWFAAKPDVDALERSAGVWPSELHNGDFPISIVGDFSWASTPELIVEACALLAYRRIRRHVNKSGVPDDVIRWSTETATFEREGVRAPGRSLTGWYDIDQILEGFVMDKVL